MLLVSWNVAGRMRRVHEQAERVLALEPDLVCLQELTAPSAGAWRELLDAAGFAVELAPLPRMRESSRPLAVISVRLASGLEVVNVHSPVSPKPGLAKVLTHEAVYRHLRSGTGPRLVCGDLNTPRREHADGSVWTFARDRQGRLRPDRGERWDAAETALIRGLGLHGFRDVFRELNGFAAKEPTWEWPRTGGGYRLDHLIASSEVEVAKCGYEHDWRRRDGLSDHSALVARLA